MKRTAFSHFEPNMPPAVSQDFIDPQLLQSPTKRPALSSVEGEHITSAAEGHIFGNPTSSSKHGESEIDDEEVATGQDPAEDDQTAPEMQTMAGLGGLATMHGNTNNLHTGYNSYMQVRRTLAINNDDYGELGVHNSAYVRTVYDAIVTYPTDMTTDQTRMVAFWGKKVKALGKDADQYMSDIASMLVAGVYLLHMRGDYLFDAQFKSLKPHKDDSTMIATERIFTICEILQSYKKHVVDLMAGHDAVTRFVAAPKGTAKRKEDYKSNNEHRSTTLSKLRAAAKFVEKDIEDEDEDADAEEDDDDA